VLGVHTWVFEVGIAGCTHLDQRKGQDRDGTIPELLWGAQVAAGILQASNVGGRHR